MPGSGMMCLRARDESNDKTPEKQDLTTELVLTVSSTTCRSALFLDAQDTFVE